MHVTFIPSPSHILISSYLPQTPDVVYKEYFFINIKGEVHSKIAVFFFSLTKRLD